MNNKRMEEKLATRECLDVRVIGKEIEPGLFELEMFLPDVDYADAKNEAWIWSIGKRISDGKIFASTETVLYNKPGFECLWLR